MSAMATNNDKKRKRLALRDPSSVMPEIDPLVKSFWFQFSFPKPGGSPIGMTARDLISRFNEFLFLSKAAVKHQGEWGARKIHSSSPSPVNRSFQNICSF